MKSCYRTSQWRQAACWLFLAVGACHGALPKSTTQAHGGRFRDSISRESQRTNFPKRRQKTFLDKSVERAVSYSFMDMHDYEDDSSDRGQLLTIMPNYEQYLWEKDPRPKVMLNHSQTLKLLGLINDPVFYEPSRAECDFPRNCFVFYNVHNEIVGWYEVCFECCVINSIPAFPASRKGGLSDRGTRDLINFCKLAGITIRRI